MDDTTRAVVLVVMAVGGFVVLIGLLALVARRMLCGSDSMFVQVLVDKANIANQTYFSAHVDGSGYGVHMSRRREVAIARALEEVAIALRFSVKGPRHE